MLSTGLLLLFNSSFFDNLRGPLLPILASTFGLSHSDTSAFLISGSVGGIIATFLLIPITRTFSERGVLMGLVVFSWLTILFSFVVSNYLTLLLFGAGIGISVSSLGAMANLVTMQGSLSERRGHALSLLHTMYGLGSFLAPNVVGISLISSIGWRMPFLLLGVMLSGVMFLAYRAFPSTKLREIELPEKVSLDRFQLFTVLLFSIYVAGEVMTSMWMVTYLVEATSKSVTESSTVLSQFYLVMMVTRAVTFVSLKHKYEKPILWVSLFLSVLFLVVGLSGAIWAFPLVGLFGPFFPLLLARVTHIFRRQAETITLWIIGVNAVFIVISHRLVGTLSDQIGITRAYWAPCLLLIIALLLLGIFLKQEKSSG